MTRTPWGQATGLLRLAVVFLSGGTLLLAQSSEGPGQTEISRIREKKKETEQRFEKTWKQYVKAYPAARTEAERIAALDLLYGLVHEKIFQELARRLDDDEAVQKKAIQLLADLDHPRSAEVLADKVRRSMADPVLMEQMTALLDKVRWNSFYAAMGEFMERKAFGVTTGELGMSKITYWVVLAAERTGNPLFADPLIRMLKRMDDNIKLPGGGDSPESLAYRKKVIEALQVCTNGPGLSDGTAYESWWKKNRTAMETRLLIVMWCPVTGKRWDRKITDTRTFCLHHEDKREALKDKSIEAFRSFR